MNASTPRARRRWVDAAVLATTIGLGALATARCGSGSTTGIDPVETRRVLAQVAQNVVLPTYERFAAAAATLEGATAAYATSLDDADRDAARAAWIEAMGVWQRLEVMQIGPAAPPTRPGGRGLRDEIDSWPLTNECRIDQEIVERAYVDREAFALELVNVRGLDAMEYLLFHDGPDNACAEVTDINATGSWAALDPTELARRRAAYAATLAYLVRAQADILAEAWRPSGDDFAGQLARSDAAPYPNASVGLNALSDGLFYLELVTKDKKLTATRLEDLEAPHAARSREHVLANLDAFQEVFLGAPPSTDAPGFDDLLRFVGEEELVDRMTTSITGAEQSVEAIDEPLETAITSQPAAVAAAHEAVRLVTEDLKGPFLTALMLRVPAEASGDTD